MPGGGGPRYTLNRTVTGAQEGGRRFEEQKNLFSLLLIETKLLGLSAAKEVHTPTALSQLYNHAFPYKIKTVS